MGHLLKLSDEYQVKGIFDHCVKFLEHQPKTEGNVIKIMILASLYNLGNVLEGCYPTIREMKHQSILREATQQEALDKETLQNIMSQRLERLETFLDQLYPQFIGVVEYCFLLFYKSDVLRKKLTWCPLHFTSGKSHSADVAERLRECLICKQMLLSIIPSSYAFCSAPTEALLSLIQDFSKLTKR